MKYVSIDIETTGLNPNTCEILEIGAVVDTPTLRLEDLPTFRFRILRDMYIGELYALSMHGELSKDLAIQPRNTIGYGTFGAYRTDIGPFEARTWCGFEDEFPSQFADWLRQIGIDPTDFVVAGKNFANFDGPFLKKIIGTTVQWHHRILDPGSMYALPSDEKVPDTNECCRRAGINPADIPGNEHTSIHDALVVIALIRKGFEQHEQT